MIFRRQSLFRNSAGRSISRLFGVLDEPISPATETVGATITLKDTPEGFTGETYYAWRLVGPASRCRVEVSVNGGSSWADASAGVAVGGSAGVERTTLVRVVATAFSGDDPEPNTYALGVLADAREADWTGAP